MSSCKAIESASQDAKPACIDWLCIQVLDAHRLDIEKSLHNWGLRTGRKIAKMCVSFDEAELCLCWICRKTARSTCRMRLQSLCRQSGMCPRQMRTASMSTRLFCFNTLLLPIITLYIVQGYTQVSFA